MENTAAWANAIEPWLVELSFGINGGQIIAVETTIVGLGDGRP
jgi:hypothetical protein